MRKVLVISGPTASGKTDLAYKIARVFPSILLNADSRQVYQHLDIISGKDLPEGSQFISEVDTLYQDQTYRIGYYRIPHSRLYLLDVVAPTQTFTVSDFVKVSEHILNRDLQNFLPIFVGGSNFYISALIRGIETLSIPPNQFLRRTLKISSVPALQERLIRLDENRFDGMNESDKQNPRRLIRAIEVAEWLQIHTVMDNKGVLLNFDTLHVGLIAPLDYLRKKIDIRINERIKSGAIDEARKLFNNYNQLADGVKMANGYRELFEYFENKISLDTAVQKWKFAEYHNAKKQLTWLKKDSSVEKFDITEKNYKAQILKRIAEWTSD